jgi:hypothetical protein
MSTTVTFQKNFPSGCPSGSGVYSEAGLTFTNNCGNRWCSPFVNRFVGTYGSPSKVIVAPASGEYFSFVSLQICNANTAIPPQTITFTGTKQNGQVVSQRFTTPSGSTAPQTFAPAGFTDLFSLIVDLGFVAFDNLVFDAEVTQTVTFNHGFPAGTPSQPKVYSEAGLSFSNSIGNRWASPYVNNFVGCDGYPSKVTVTPAAGKTFNFKSIQMCNPNSAVPSQPVTFIGTLADKSTVRAAFTTPHNNTAPQTFSVSNFNNLVSLEMDLGFVAFDNLVFSE